MSISQCQCLSKRKQARAPLRKGIRATTGDGEHGVILGALPNGKVSLKKVDGKIIEVPRESLTADEFDFPTVCPLVIGDEKVQAECTGILKAPETVALCQYEKPISSCHQKLGERFQALLEKSDGTPVTESDVAIVDRLQSGKLSGNFENVSYQLNFSKTPWVWLIECYS